MSIKKYKLIKEFYGSPKAGTIVMKANDYPHYNFNGGDFTTAITQYFVENTPEFWEEVKEKEWEIYGFKHKSEYPIIAYIQINGTYQSYLPMTQRERGLSLTEMMMSSEWSVYSIKRLSDNQIFSIGDKITCQNSHRDNPEAITKIALNKEGTPCLFTNSFYNNGINIFKAIKNNCLFVTEDGVEIFEGNKYYCVHFQDSRDIQPSWNKIPLFECYGPNNATKETDNIKYTKDAKYFSTEKAANDWIKMNKPKYSMNDLINCCENMVFPHGKLLTRIDVYKLQKLN